MEFLKLPKPFSISPVPHICFSEFITAFLATKYLHSPVIIGVVFSDFLTFVGKTGVVLDVEYRGDVDVIGGGKILGLITGEDFIIE